MVVLEIGTLVECSEVTVVHLVDFLGGRHFDEFVDIQFFPKTDNQQNEPLEDFKTVITKNTIRR